MRLNSKIGLAVLFLMLILSFVYRFYFSGYPGEIKTTLRLSDFNREELQEVLKYFHSKKNKEKYKAAVFLLSDMYFHFNRRTYITDFANNEIKFIATDYPNKAKVEEAFDSIRNIYNFNSKYKFDCQTVKAEYLIENIEKAWNTWQESPWNKSIDFQQFCEYILPYRAYHEPLSDWRDTLATLYGKILDSLPEVTILNACKAINKAIALDIKYDRRWMIGTGTLSVPELMASGSGMCDDITAYGICAMRACGIPVTVDFTLWPKMNYGHSWCVVFDENGKPWSFGPGEENPGEHINIFYKFSLRKLSKVYRHTYSINKESLGEIANDLENIPPFFRRKNIKDVTNEYIETQDVFITFENIPESHSYLYLCIFNLARWAPLQWAGVENNEACFTDMGTGVVYLAGYYERNRINPLGSPFILRENGRKDYLNGDGKVIEKIKLQRWLGSKRWLKNGDTHELFYWNGEGWSYHSSNEVKDSVLVFENVPSKPLYKLESNSRIFTIDGDKQKWW